MSTSGINDLPINDLKEDVFQVTPYVTALSEFIKESPTPITIALQGGWGTGKTSFMNMIIEELEPIITYDEQIVSEKNKFGITTTKKITKESYSAPIITIKFNTWQYSQFHLQESLAVSFLNYMIEKLSEDVTDINDIKEKAVEMIKFIGILTTNIALSPYGAQISEDMFQKHPSLDAAKAIENLKATLASIVQKRLEQHESKNTRLVIFIDDLDRLNPAITVNLLEVIKLFLDIEGCVFVLAVDNRVIEEGIALTKETSKEKTRSFLDKMIQVPFKIPIENYDYQLFLKNNINLFDEKYLNNKKVPREELENLIRYSVGSNPRAMKRLINNYILNEKVNSKIYKGDKANFDEGEQALLLSVICMQLAFQPLYMTLLNTNDDDILDILNKTLQGENEELLFTDVLQKKILDSHYLEMYDEDINTIKADIPRYDVFLTLLKNVILKIHSKDSDKKIEYLEEIEIRKFIEIMQRAQMTSGSQNVTEVKKEKELGEAIPITLQQFNAKGAQFQAVERPINFKDKSYSPKDGFIAILNHFADEKNINRLSNPEILKENKISSIIYNPLLPDDERSNNKYGTIEVGDDKVTIGYHFSTKESLRQLQKILNDILQISDYDDLISITAQPILNQ